MGWRQHLATAETQPASSRYQEGNEVVVGFGVFFFPPIVVPRGPADWEAEFFSWHAGISQESELDDSRAWREGSPKLQGV